MLLTSTNAARAASSSAAKAMIGFTPTRSGVLRMTGSVPSIDPAPIAAASSSGRTAATWVARVRPGATDPTSPKVLELGHIAADGAFVPRETVPTTGNATDVSLALDGSDALWLGWVDSGGSWLERLACH